MAPIEAVILKREAMRKKQFSINQSKILIKLLRFVHRLHPLYSYPTRCSALPPAAHAPGGPPAIYLKWACANLHIRTSIQKTDILV